MLFRADSKRTRAFLTAALASMSFAALADSYIVHQAYEIAVAELRLPGNENGTVSFRDCKKCAVQTIQVTPDTRYVLNGRTVSLPAFRRAVATISNQRQNIATVIHYLESDSIVEIQVFE